MISLLIDTYACLVKPFVRISGQTPDPIHRDNVWKLIYGPSILSLDNEHFIHEDNYLIFLMYDHSRTL